VTPADVGAPRGRPAPPARAAAAPDAVAPDGSEIRLLADARHGATRASLVEVRLPPGAVSRPVRHRTVEEIWCVLEGEGAVWRQPPDGAGETARVHPGDALVIPPGWAFQFRAGPGGPLRFLCWTSPPWPGEAEAVPAGPGGLGPATV
jgi:mannose-6-phosphate isomerase-like protein (cupin superfamily)